MSRTRRIRAKLITTPSDTGSAPPDRPVPAPRATNGTPGLGAGRHHERKLLGGLRQRHERRDHPVAGDGVALEGAESGQVSDDPVGSELPDDLVAYSLAWRGRAGASPPW